MPKWTVFRAHVRELKNRPKIGKCFGGPVAIGYGRIRPLEAKLKNVRARFHPLKFSWGESCVHEKRGKILGVLSRGSRA